VAVQEQAGERPAEPVEALAQVYLATAGGNPSLALRLALADACAHCDELARAVRSTQGLISHGYARRGLRSKQDAGPIRKP
jgi:hypothetical protein